MTNKQILQKLQQAKDENRSVHIEYINSDGEFSDRVIKIKEVGKKYAFKAYCEKRKAIISFRADRIQKLEILGDPMSEDKPMLQRVIDAGKEDAPEVLVRVSARKLVKMARGPIELALSQGLNIENEETKKQIASLMASPVGEAMVSVVLSLVLGALPLPQNQRSKMDLLVTELRRNGETVAGDTVADILTGPIRELLGNQLGSLPIFQEEQPEEKVEARAIPSLEVPEEFLREEEEEEEEEEELVLAKQTLTR